MTEPFEPNLLVARVAADRDRQAFEALFLAFAPKVKAMLMRQGADAATAEEIAQETLLTVWRKAAMFDTAKGSFATWVYTIARNQRIDRLRREVVWQELGEDQDEVAEDGPLPDEQVASHEIQSRIRRILAALPADQVQVVLLSYVEGLSHAEIAERTGLPLGTVKSRMRLAYQKVRAAFEILA